jgi:hypothetical protein
VKRSAPILRRSALARSKYGNKRVLVGERMFDSKGEAGRAMELRIMEKAGLIERLQFQVTFPLYGKNGAEVARYRADFTYHCFERGVDVVEDFKGLRTDIYRLKAKLFRDNYGFAITESTATRRRR